MNENKTGHEEIDLLILLSFFLILIIYSIVGSLFNKYRVTFILALNIIV